MCPSQGVHSFRGRTAAIMRAHNIAQEVSVAKALAAESAEEAQYLSENAVAIDFGNESRTFILFLDGSCAA